MKTLNWMVCAAGLLVAGVNTEIRAAAPEAMTRMVRMLAETDDAQLQLDILRGLSAGFRGQERLPMPAGWEQVESRLGGSANGDVRTLVQTLSLTFGSQGAQKALRALAADPKAEAGARRNALDSLMASRDPELRALLHHH